MSDIILCMDGFSTSDKEPRFALINFCLSYPRLSHNHKYALFYKWVPWIMILLCVLLYTPKIVVNNFSCKYIASCLDAIYKLNNLFQWNREQQRYIYLEDADKNDEYINGILQSLKYIRWNKCKKIYQGCLICHIYAFFLNITLFLLLNFLLQGRFLLYIPTVFPFRRNVTHFSDEMTKEFYPFVNCTIPMDLIQPSRTEVLICHLTLMEYYEKIFFILWIFLFFLLIITILYIIFILTFIIHCKNTYNKFFLYLLKKSLNFNHYNIIKNSNNEYSKKGYPKYSNEIL